MRTPTPKLGDSCTRSCRAGAPPVLEPCSSRFLVSLVHDFGGKDIGFVAGVVLLINNITGPGVPSLPNLFVEAGWLLPVTVTLIVWVMTTFSCSMYCEAMRFIPGNEHFRDRIEYSTIVRFFFGRKWYIAAMVGLCGALQSLNIISIIQSSQVMDNAISAIWGKTCGLNLTPFQSVWSDTDGHPHSVEGSTAFLSCVEPLSPVGNAWGCHVVVSLGFLLTACMAIPFGAWNLDDNMIVQKVAFVLTLLCWLMWIGASLSAMDDMASLPAINTDPETGSQAGVLGSILFNFGFVTTVPSWVNEKHPRVSVNRSLWLSTGLCVVIFFCVGLPAALAFPSVLQGPVTGKCARSVAEEGFNCSNDLMQLLTTPGLAPASWSGPVSSALLRSSVYVFPIVAIVSSIPVFSIVIKYNLVENGFSRKSGFFWGVVFPWLVSLPLLYQPQILSQFVNFTSLVFVTFTDFVVPCLLYIKLRSLRRERPGALLDDESPVTGSVHVHHACPAVLRRKGWVGAVLIVVLLSISAAVAFVLSVMQGSYTFNLQVCATVGN